MIDNTEEIKLSKEDKKQIRLVVDRYLRIKFKKKFKKITGIKLK